MQIHLGTGRRKSAVARVRLLPGAGTVVVNKKPVEEYFSKIKTLVRRISNPLRATNTEGTYNVHVTVGGGGQSGQAGAILHGIARALCRANLSFRPILKSLGFLTRDPRMKERKKYGQRGARARYQFSKR